MYDATKCNILQFNKFVCPVIDPEFRSNIVKVVGEADVNFLFQSVRSLTQSRSLTHRINYQPQYWK